MSLYPRVPSGIIRMVTMEGRLETALLSSPDADFERDNAGRDVRVFWRPG
jgi:hypothetical protein